MSLAVGVLALGCGDPKELAASPPSSEPVQRPLVTAPVGGPATRLPRTLPIRDVSQVQLQPDGTFRRFCGPAPEASRQAMEQARRRMAQ